MQTAAWRHGFLGPFKRAEAEHGMGFNVYPAHTSQANSDIKSELQSSRKRYSIDFRPRSGSPQCYSVQLLLYGVSCTEFRNPEPA